MQGSNTDSIYNIIYQSDISTGSTGWHWHKNRTTSFVTCNKNRQK